MGTNVVGEARSQMADKVRVQENVALRAGDLLRRGYH